MNPWGANNGPTDTYTGEYLIPEWAQSVDTRKGYLRVTTLEKHINMDTMAGINVGGADT